MSGIVQGLGDLVVSVVEIFKGILETAYAAVASVFALVAGLLSNFFSLFEGVVGFVLGNIFVLGTIAAVFMVFAWYRAKQGNPIIVGDKKLA